jgi:hypothetical protein
MQITRNNPRVQKIAPILFAATVCASALHAAEKVRWEDLNQFVDIQSDKHASVVKKDGTRLQGAIVVIRPTELAIWGDDFPITTVARENVARIVFRRNGHYLEMLLNSVVSSLIAPAIVFMPEIRPAALLTPVIWAYTAITAPYFLIAQGASWLRIIPAKVIEIVQ